jgi:chemotaxis signal transduction protein
MPASSEPEEKTFSFITFTIGDEEYAVNSEHVVSVVPRFSDLERDRIARSLKEDVLQGVTDALVVNLHQYLGKSPGAVDPQSRFIMLDHETRKIAILVDHMNDLFCCEAREYNVHQPQKVHIQGMATVREVEIQNKRLQLLDLDEIVGNLIAKRTEDKGEFAGEE